MYICKTVMQHNGGVKYTLLSLSSKPKNNKRNFIQKKIKYLSGSFLHNSSNSFGIGALLVCLLLILNCSCMV